VRRVDEKRADGWNWVVTPSIESWHLSNKLKNAVGW
jgi:hypothetical protein